MPPTDWFTALVDETLPAVSRYALRRAPTAADAEDVVAETYAVAWRRRHQVPQGDEAVLWLYGVARNVLANQRRAGRRWDRLRAKVGGHRPVEPPPVLPGDSDEHADVRAALATLAPTDAELLRLLAWEQLSHAEAAEALGLSENAVALRASRARRKLSERLGDRSGGDADMEGRTTKRRSDAV